MRHPKQLTDGVHSHLCFKQHNWYSASLYKRGASQHVSLTLLMDTSCSNCLQGSQMVDNCSPPSIPQAKQNGIDTVQPVAGHVAAPCLSGLGEVGYTRTGRTPA